MGQEHVGLYAEDGRGPKRGQKSEQILGYLFGFVTWSSGISVYDEGHVNRPLQCTEKGN